MFLYCESFLFQHKTICNYNFIFFWQDEKYAHIEESEMKKVSEKIEEKFKWFNEKMQQSGKSSFTSTPVVFPAQILSEKKVLS